MLVVFLIVRWPVTTKTSSLIFSIGIFKKLMPVKENKAYSSWLKMFVQKMDLCKSTTQKNQRLSNSISGQKKKWQFLTIYHLKSKKKHTPPLTKKKTQTNEQQNSEATPLQPLQPHQPAGPWCLRLQYNLSFSHMELMGYWWRMMVDQLILFGDRAKKKAQNSQNAALLRFFSLKRCSLKLWINWINCQDLSGLS